MAAPPTKRQRRLEVLSSDDERDDHADDSNRLQNQVGKNSQPRKKVITSIETGNSPLSFPSSRTIPPRTKLKQQPLGSLDGRSRARSSQTTPASSPEKRRRKKKPDESSRSLHS